MITLRSCVATLIILVHQAAPLSTDPLGSRPNREQKLPEASVPATPSKASIVSNTSAVLTAAERYSRSYWPPTPQTAYISSDLRLPGGAQMPATVESSYVRKSTHSLETSSTSTASNVAILRKEIPNSLEQIITEKDFSDVGYAKITNQSSIVGNRGQASSVIVSQKVAKLCSELQAEVERLKMDVPIDGEAKHVLAKLEQKLSTTTAEVEAACVIADDATFQQSQRKIEWPFGQAKASAVVAEGHQNVSGTFSKNSVEEKILSLESQLKIQASTHEAAVSAHNANVTEMEGRIRKFKASVVAAQTREKYLKELLHLAEANGNQTIEQINGLKKELSVAKAAAIAEELKCTELEVSLFAANKTEVLLRNQLATQMEASTNALRAASALSEHLLTQVKELEATISATHTEKEALQKSIESLSGVSKNTKEDVLKLQKELASKRAAAAAAAAKSEQELANVTARSCELEAEVETLTTKLASEVASREVAETAAASAQEAAAKASFAAAAMRTRSVAQAEDLKEEVRKAQAEALEAREEASAVLRHAAEALPEEQPKRGWLGRFGHRRGAAVVSPGDTNPLQSVRRKSAGKTGALKPVVEGNEPKGNLMPVSLRAMKLLALFCMSSLVTRALIP